MSALKFFTALPDVVMSTQARGEWEVQLSNVHLDSNVRRILETGSSTSDVVSQPALSLSLF